MFSYWHTGKTGGVIVSILGLFLLLRGGTVAQVPGIRSIPLRPRNVFLDNGSLQPGLPGAIATLPLFLRNGGHFGFGSGGFQQFTLSNPQSVIIPPGQVGGVGMAGGAGAAGAAGGCGGGFSGGVNTGQATFGGGGAGQTSAFFPCALNQGQLIGALVQRVFLDGFIPQYNVAVPPQIHGGIPTLPVQMATGFGSLQGTLFIGVNGAAGAAGLNGIQGQQAPPQGAVGIGVGIKGGFNGFAGNCY